MPGKYVGNEWFTERECAMIDLLQDALYKLETGAEDKIGGSSPTYIGLPISDDKVDAAIAGIDEEFAFEIKNYPSYHETRSGAKTVPSFNRLGKAAKRRLVEALQEVKHTTIMDQPMTTPSGLPVTTDTTPTVLPPDYYEWC